MLLDVVNRTGTHGNRSFLAFVVHSGTQQLPGMVLHTLRTLLTQAPMTRMQNYQNHAVMLSSQNDNTRQPSQRAPSASSARPCRRRLVLEWWRPRGE